jgi:hypothetical protein
MGAWKSADQLARWIEQRKEDYGDADSSDYLMLELLRARERERTSLRIALAGVTLSLIAFALSVVTLFAS